MEISTAAPRAQGTLQGGGGGRIVRTGDEADLCEWCLLDTTGLCAHEFPAAVGPV